MAIGLLLASLAPIGLREDFTTSFRWFDIYNGTRMKAMLARGMVDPDSRDKPIGRIAYAMPDELRRKLRRVGEGDEVRIPLSLLTDSLNELIDSPESEWYDADSWKSTTRLRELRELDESPDEELSESLLKRRSRLRLEAALPSVFEARSDRSVLLTYLGLDFPTTFAVDRNQFEIVFNQFVIPTLVHWLLGFVLVFLGILVTASMIPDMLQTGSLHLLLSKPVSRWAVLISKFIGGCAFVFLCVLLLVIGLYLIAGLRLQIWNARILYCVPVAVMLFAVFFSVSVPAGLKWRSAIISIAAAGALAAVCVVVGVVGGVVDARIVERDRIQGMTMAGEDLFAVTGGSGLNRWDEETSSWVGLIDSEAMSRDRVLSPLAMDEDHVLTARIRNGRFSPFGSGSLDLIVLDRDQKWEAQRSLRLPNATERLLRLSGNQIAARNSADVAITSRGEILKSVGELDEDAAKDENDDEDGSDGKAGKRRTRSGSGLGAWLQALTTLQGGATEDFNSILPDRVTLDPPTRVSVALSNTVSTETGASEPSLVLLSRNTLMLMRADQDDLDGPWRVAAKVEVVRDEESYSPSLAAGTQRVLLALNKTEVQLHDLATLELAATWVIDASDQIVDLLAISNDRFCLLKASGNCELLEFNEADDRLHSLGDLNVSAVEAIAFDERSDVLMVASQVDRVSLFPASDLTFSPSRVLRPRLSTWRTLDRYVMGTLEMLTPQVLQLGETASAMVSGEQAFIMDRDNSGSTEVVRYRIAEPLLNCSIFIAVMLLLSCIYFGRSDF